jgi:hypothetical protein
MFQKRLDSRQHAIMSLHPECEHAGSSRLSQLSGAYHPRLTKISVQLTKRRTYVKHMNPSPRWKYGHKDHIKCCYPCRASASLRSAIHVSLRTPTLIVCSKSGPAQSLLSIAAGAAQPLGAFTAPTPCFTPDYLILKACSRSTFIRRRYCYRWLLSIPSKMGQIGSRLPKGSTASPGDHDLGKKQFN